MSDIVDRLLEPDWHDPACPFLKHCYCDDGAPHDAVRHPLAREAADEIASLRARVEWLEAALASEREDNLWNAYHSGHVKDGEWDHMCMSDGEWLAHECGFNVKDRRIADADIRAAIPEAARQALKDTPDAE